jgi:hypothetical protein
MQYHLSDLCHMLGKGVVKRIEVAVVKVSQHTQPPSQNVFIQLSDKYIGKIVNRQPLKGLPVFPPLSMVFPPHDTRRLYEWSFVLVSGVAQKYRYIINFVLNRLTGLAPCHKRTRTYVQHH